jgi:DNA (cytosine-5)-methyltransferase 1
VWIRKSKAYNIGYGFFVFSSIIFSMSGKNENKRKFKFIDLFSGIGGFHQAMVKLGGECVLASDIDSDCRDVYEKNYGIKPFADIRLIDENLIPDHDVLCAGFPCQPFSKGGFQNGFTDTTRGTLFYEIVRIIKAKKPRFLILENVRNLASHDGGNTWKVIIESLHELGYRVSSKPFIISPHKLSPVKGGAPQIRERVVILAERLEYSKRRKEKNLNLDWDFSPENYPTPNWSPQDWDFKDWVSKHKAAEKDLTTYNISNDDKKILLTWGSFISKLKKDSPIGFPIMNYALSDNNKNDGLPEWKIDFHNKNANLYTKNKIMIDKWRLKKKPELFNPSKQKLEWQAQDASRNKESDILELLIQFRPSGIRVKKPTYVGALVAMVQTPVMGWLGRRITPSEAGTLQGFGTKFKRAEKDQIAYKQFGNAVNINVIKFSAEALFKRCNY